MIFSKTYVFFLYTIALFQNLIILIILRLLNINLWRRQVGIRKLSPVVLNLKKTAYFAF